MPQDTICGCATPLTTVTHYDVCPGLSWPTNLDSRNHGASDEQYRNNATNVISISVHC